MSSYIYHLTVPIPGTFFLLFIPTMVALHALDLLMKLYKLLEID